MVDGINASIADINMSIINTRGIPFVGKKAGEGNDENGSQANPSKKKSAMKSSMNSTMSALTVDDDILPTSPYDRKKKPYVTSSSGVDASKGSLSPHVPKSSATGGADSPLRLPAIHSSQSSSRSQPGSYDASQSHSFSPQTIFRISHPQSFAFTNSFNVYSNNSLDNQDYEEHLDTGNDANQQQGQPGEEAYGEYSSAPKEDQAYFEPISDATVDYNNTTDYYEAAAAAEAAVEEDDRSMPFEIMHQPRAISPFERETGKLRGSEKLAAGIIKRARISVSANPEFQIRKVSMTEMKLIKSPFAKKLWIETEDTKAILAKISVSTDTNTTAGMTIATTTSAVAAADAKVRSKKS